MAQLRGVRLRGLPPLSPPLAIIVGIAEHAEPRLALQAPVRDAEALAALLREQHGYEVVLRCDGEATRAGLERLFEVELPALVDAERRVFVYFAGHGVVIPSVEHPRGYLVPADGDNQEASLYPMASLCKALAALPCRHLLLLLDCCFGGAFRWSAMRDVVVAHAPELYRQRYERYLAAPAWQVITSAAHDERASDLIAGMATHRRSEAAGELHSPFFEALRDGLAGEADRGTRASPRGDGIITATELYLHLRDRLEPGHAGAPSQTPQLWLFEKHGKGEYIFHVPGREPELPEAAPLGRASSPYRGLEVYERQHARYFHGRRAATAELLARIERQPLTVVVGRSGTGKSSLVQAGLVPAIERGHPAWQIEGPLRAAEAVKRLTALAESGKATADESAPVGSTSAEAAPARATVLVIEHLEELFDTPERGGPQDFLEALGAAAARSDLRIVGTLRDDLETELWVSPLGARWPQIRFPLADLTREELREAIERPAEQMVLTFDPPDMVDRLIDSVVSMPGALPLLSFTLEKLYLECVERAADDRRLVEVDRLDTGGLALALRGHADAIHDRLDESTADTLRRVLLRLVTVKQAAVTRRRVALEELRFADPEEQRRVDAVLDALTGRPLLAGHGAEAAPPGLRLAIRGRDPDGRGGFVELAHDAVARDWPRLRSWWTAAQEELHLLHRLAAAAEEWDRGKQSNELLWLDRRRLAKVSGALTAKRMPAGAAPGPGPLASPYLLNRREAEFFRRSRWARRFQLVGGRRGLAVMLAIALVAFKSDRSMRAERARAEASDRIERGIQASTEARKPGQEPHALVTAIKVLADALDARDVAPEVLRGATDAAGYRRTGLPFQSGARSVACSTDGVWFAASAPDGGLLVGSNGQSWSLPHEHAPGGPAPVGGDVHTAAVFMPDGAAVAVGDDLGHVALWPLARVRPPRPTRTIGEHGNAIRVLAASPDGRYVATGAPDGSVRIWTLDGTDPIPIAERLGDAVTALVFSEDGAWLAASSLDGVARVWSIADGRLAFELTSDRFQGGIAALDLSPDGRSLVTVGDHTTIWSLDRPDGASQSLEESVLFARFAHGGQDLIVGRGDHTIESRDARSLRKLETLIKGDPAFSTLRYCGGSHGALVIDEPAGSYIRNLGRDNASAVLGSRRRPVVAVAFAPGDRSVFAASGERGMPAARLERWDVESGMRLVSGLEGDFEPSLLVLTPDREALLVRTSEGAVLAWEISRGSLRSARSDDDAVVERELAALPHHDESLGGGAQEVLVGAVRGRELRKRSVSQIIVSPRAGRRLRIYRDGKLDLLDELDASVATIYDHSDAVRTARFSPDGTLVVTAGDDGLVRLWDARTGAALAGFTGHDGPVLAVAFSSDGERIATGGADGTIRVFPVTPEGILALVCSRLAGATSRARLEDLVADRCAPR